MKAKQVVLTICQVTEDEEQRLSTTQSDFETKHTNHQLLVINKEFVVNWKNLTEDFNSKNNKEKRHKFRENHCPKDRDKIINEWKKFIVKKKLNITFYLWYEKYYGKCNVITKTQWLKEDKTKVKSSHPPLETIVITVNNDFVTASPFKIPSSDEDKKIIEQNNFTNQYIATIGKQLDKIEEMFDEKILIEKPISKIEKPLLNLPQNRSKLGLPNNEKDTIKNI